MKTYYFSFVKDPAVRLEFLVLARGRHEARLIAEKEAASLKGYRFQGSN